MILQVNINLNGESLTKETLQHVHQLLLMELSSVTTDSTTSTINDNKEPPQQADKPNESAPLQSNAGKTDPSKTPNKSQLTLPEVQSAFMELAKAKGNKEAKKLLEKYNATKVTELSEDLYADALEDIKQVMGNA